MNAKNLSLFVHQMIGNPQKWHEFLPTLAEIIDAKAAAIAVEDLQLRWASFYLTHGMDHATTSSYSRYYVGLNPWALRRPSTAGEVRTSEESISEKEFRETEFYNGWFKPRSWGHASSIVLGTTETERAYLFVTRPPNHPFTEKELDILKDLAPYLALASQIEQRLIRLKNENYRLRSRMPGQFDAIARFNLTPTEARIAVAIVQGQSPKEIAFRADLTIATVRWHVKRIYQKLGVTRQADLMLLLLNPPRQ